MQPTNYRKISSTCEFFNKRNIPDIFISSYHGSSSIQIPFMLVTSYKLQ